MSNRKDVLATLLAVTALLLWTHGSRSRRMLAGVALVASAGAKETVTLGAIPLLLLCDRLAPQPAERRPEVRRRGLPWRQPGLSVSAPWRN